MNNKAFLRISHKKVWIFSVLCLITALVFALFARYAEGFAQWYAIRIYPLLQEPAARLFSVWSGSFSEAMILALIFFMVLCFSFGACSLLFHWKYGKRTLFTTIRSFVCLLAFLVMIYTLNCSVNYHRDGIGTVLQLPAKSASRENLIKLSRVLADEITALTEDPNWKYSYLSDTDEALMRSEAVSTMERFGKTEPTLSGYYPEPKPVYFSGILTDAGIEGIFSPITMEANYNREMTPFLIPYAMCHELAHLKGYMKEADAGMIAYMACKNSPYPVFRYSGIFHALIFTLNELRTEASAEEFNEIYARLPKEIRYQLFYLKEKSLSDQSSATSAARTVNDLYLKANAQSGIESYNNIVDLLISEYADRIEKEELI